MSLWSKVRDYFFEPASVPAADEPAPRSLEVETHEEFVAHAIAQQVAAGYYPVSEEPLHGQRVEKAGSPTKPVGVSGQVWYGGYHQSNERNPEMMGAAKWAFFEDAKRNVGAIGLGMRVYLTLAGTPDWNIEPWKPDDADEPTAEDVEKAKWFEASLHKMDTPWKTVTQIALLAAWEGFNMQAWHVRRDALGRLALADLFWLEGHTIEKWLTDERGKITGIVQRSPQSGEEVPVPREQIALNQDIPLSGSPERIGILRQLAETIRQLKITEKALGKGFEKDANQTPVIFGPIAERKGMIGQFDQGLNRIYTQADFDAEFRGAVEYATADKRKGAVVVLDSSPYKNDDGATLSNVPRWRFEVVKATMESAAAQSVELKRLTWIALAFVNLDFLMLGSDGVGSLAMASSKMEGFRRSLMQALNSWAQVLRRDVIQPVWKRNGWDPDTAPTPTFEALELEDIAGMVQSLAALLTAGGVEPGRIDHIIDRILGVKGLPPLKDRDDADMVIRREEAAEAAGLKRRTGEDEEDEDLDEEED